MSVQPKRDLYRYLPSCPGDQKVLIAVRYPTPFGWKIKTSKDVQDFWKDVHMDKVFAPPERFKRKSSSEKEEI
eukprot:11588875-Ditylum_brightwellii.AAC.1